jgi:hypothetical protein
MVEIEFHKVKVSIIIFIAIISQLIMYLDCWYLSYGWGWATTI